MTLWTLIRRSLRFHARAHLGVVLGAAIGSAVLIGALVVGDSVRESLTDTALSRLGGIHFALSAPDRLFRSNLRLGNGTRSQPVRVGPSTADLIYPRFPEPQAAALVLPGIVARQDGTARANRVNVLGVVGLQAAWGVPIWSKLAPAGWPMFPPENALMSAQDYLARYRVAAEWGAGSAAFINQTLARQLGVRPGDEIILRVRKPSALGLDAAISPRTDDTFAFRLKVGVILTPGMLGDFSLGAQSAPPPNLFLPRSFLAGKLGASVQVAAGANLLVTGPITAPRLYDKLANFRYRLSSWLWRHTPRLPPPAGAPAGFGGVPNPHTLTGVLARWVQPKSSFLSGQEISQSHLPDELFVPWLNDMLAQGWALEDAGLSVSANEPPAAATGGEPIRPYVELTSARIFLEPAVAAAALTPRTNSVLNVHATHRDTSNDVAAARFVTNGLPILTYLANLIRSGDHATPYSMVTAADRPYVPADMRDDEIVVSQWLADDLQVKPGDTVALSYYVADSGSRLLERTNSFRVRQVVPLQGIYADRTLMPEFPGLAKAESTHDWHGGFPLVYPIRPKDEAYWKTYRGTPKAFITLAAGQAMWANRFGRLTSIRYEVPNDMQISACREIVYLNLLANLKPSDVGLQFQAVREQALKAATQGQDFGQLFLGFSLFLVVGALLLMATLFQFSLEQRAAEVGILLAVGLTPKQVRWLLLLEGVVLALLGGIVGALGGLGYAKAMVWALTTQWRSAIGNAQLQFHATAASVITGFCASAVVAALTIWLALRKQTRLPARMLLAGEAQGPKSKGQGRGPWLAMASGLAAIGLLAWALLSGNNTDPGVFFGAGSLLLISGLALAAAWLGRLAQPSRFTFHVSPATRHPSPVALGALAVRACARRRKRSLATIALLACGSFLVAAIGVFRLDANRDATRRDSGTGGFALIGESTLPITQDLNTKAGQEAYGLDPHQLLGVKVVPLRVHEGDVASCLNLNRAQKPRLLGVNPALLAGRFTFASVAKGLDRSQGWELLRGDKSQIVNRKSQIAEVPAIGDANAIEWAMGKSLGDTIDYADEQGRPFKVRLVGAVANSILQGSLLIDEAEFTRRFPGEGGYRMFLIDAPTNSAAQASAALSRALQDKGLELTPAVQRLNEFNAVQNTYLGTFQILGGLGLLLGSAGLGVVVLRNMLERRGELGLLTAVGFRRRLLYRLVLSEHGALLAFGLALGALAAAVAVLPAILSPGTHLPYASLALTLAAVLLNGLLWTWLATAWALRGNLLSALRNE